MTYRNFCNILAPIHRLPRYYDTAAGNNELLIVCTVTSKERKYFYGLRWTRRTSCHRNTELLVALPHPSILCDPGVRPIVELLQATLELKPGLSFIVPLDFYCAMSGGVASLEPFFHKGAASSNDTANGLGRLVLLTKPSLVIGKIDLTIENYAARAPKSDPICHCGAHDLCGAKVP